jgi:hypothetical protein
VASAAYISREKYWDQRNHETHDYSSIREASDYDVRHNGRLAPLHVGLYAPANAPDWCHGAENIERFWNAAEQAERRRDAQIGEKIIIALPAELSLEQNKWLVQDHVRDFTREGRVAQVAIHSGEQDPRNIHAHLLVSTRGVNEHGFNPTKAREQQERYLNRADLCERAPGALGKRRQPPPRGPRRSPEPRGTRCRPRAGAAHGADRRN